ncbi:GlsB/YeaQ/YmgE family stress response membrane protein [Actinoplanes sp. M2I2]|uniref:GlsB/YeaQ/YmgE family stress response membrane protein n=1 Tax=Actinoplanes sp. M2I2 TaxID=1734444 RepID=UPI00201FBE57|nr:GlsB/YeaQ/YmgE family stress response membrane protein [Actinoplanes sp. M2I2]
MTVTSLVTAVVIGGALGVAGHLLTKADRRVPFWLPPTVGVGAAVFATTVARIAADLPTGLSLAELTLQVVFGGAGVAAVVTTGDRRTPEKEGLR